MNFASNTIAELSTAHHASPVTEPQMELAFVAGSACPPVSRRQRRLRRATWWFERMRQIVDRACDWQPARPTRPEQIWFPNTHRSVSAAPELNPDQRQICE